MFILICYDFWELILFTESILFLEGKGTSGIKQEQLEMVVGNNLTSEV